MSQRPFVRDAAAVAPDVAAPSIVPARVLRSDAPSNTINMAIIGAGTISQFHYRNMIVTPPNNARIRVACDCFRDRREAYARKVNEAYGADYCQPVADFRDVLARDDIDGVIIGTPDHWHVPIAYRAAMAGKSMYVEKPLSVSMSWAWKLRDVIATNHVQFQYGTQQRSSPGFRLAVELVRNGYLGDVQRIECWCPNMSQQYGDAHVPPYGCVNPADPPAGFDYDMWLGPAPRKPYTIDRCTRFGSYHIYDYSIGFIAGWGAHPLDIAQWGMDADHTSPVHYEGTGTVPPAGALWNNVEAWDVTCRYANGVELRLMDEHVAKPIISHLEGRPWCDHGTTFFGTEGWVSVDRAGCHVNINGKSVDPDHIEFKPSDWRAPQSTNHVHNLIDCMRSGESTLSPLESAIRSDAISHLSEIAVRLGRPIQWNPQTERIVDDALAAEMLERPMREPWGFDPM